LMRASKQAGRVSKCTPCPAWLQGTSIGRINSSICQQSRIFTSSIKVEPDRIRRPPLSSASLLYRERQFH
jgi:hypothetical protein